MAKPKMLEEAAAGLKELPPAQPAAKTEIDDGPLPADLGQVRQLAAQKEPDAVKLLKRKGAPGEPAPDEPPRPPTAAPAPAPRAIHENERAPEGLVRFKIRCINYGSDFPNRYILAASEEDARRCYADAVGLTAVLAAIGEGAKAPYFNVRKLAD